MQVHTRQFCKIHSNFLPPLTILFPSHTNYIQNTMDTNWLSSLTSPVVFLSFAATLICNYILSPRLLNFVAPHHDFGQKTVNMQSLFSSTIHAIISSAGTVLLLLQGDLVEDKVFGVNSTGVILLHVTVGYAFGDIFVCVMDPYLRGVVSNFLHHFATIAGILFTLHNGMFLFFTHYRFFSEFSTPFVNWRALLHEKGNKNSRQYALAAISMTISFFLCRVVVIPWHSYVMFASLLSAEASSVPLILKVYTLVNYVTFDILNVFWFYKILKGGYNFYSKKRHNKL